MALTDNLVAFWELEEASGSRVDAVNGYNLTQHNTPSSGTGIVGTAASFSKASSQYLDVADNADLSGGNTDWTVMLWLKPNSVDSSAYQAAGKGDGTGYEWIIELTAGNRFQFRAATASGEANQTAIADGGGFGNGNAPSAATWYIVFAWHDAAADKLHIATSANSLTDYEIAFNSAGVWDSTGPFALGRPCSYFPSYWDGLIDQVGFWRRVLTSGERTSLYNSGAGLSYATMSAGSGPASMPRKALLGVGQ